MATTRASCGYVYMLHVRGGLATGKKCSIHYVGWSRCWTYRVRLHRTGRAQCAFTNECFRRGLTLDVAVVVRANKALERRIKRGGHYDRWCPRCGGRLVDYRYSEQALHIASSCAQMSA